VSTLPPLVLVTSCNRVVEDASAHIANRPYVDAVRLAGALPLICPPMPPEQLPLLLDQVAGVLITGSPSNVHPSHFGEAVHNPSLPLDPERDGWTLPLVRLLVERQQPFFAICRGAQEVNVALGGSLHQAIHEQPGLADHRDDPADPEAVQWGPAHPVQVHPGGVLQQLWPEPRFMVNSLHGQGVNRLAPGLRLEASAPDGVVEAFSVPLAGFNLCLQWHPEWRAETNPVSMALLGAFGRALREWQAQAARAR
jgi:putative glutamine amidotransferase